MSDDESNTSTNPSSGMKNSISILNYYWTCIIDVSLRYNIFFLLLFTEGNDVKPDVRFDRALLHPEADSIIISDDSDVESMASSKKSSGSAAFLKTKSHG